MKMRSLFSIVAALAIAACGSSKHEAAAPSGGGSAEPAMGSAAGSASGSAAGSAATELGSAAAETESAAGSAAGSAASPAPVADTNVAGGDKPWKDMDKKERSAFMKKVVLPKAKELFATIDPKMKTTCKTCHGKGADDHSFKMPTPDIKPLPATEEAFMAWIQKNPDEGKWAKFMGEQFTPAMAQLFGMKAFDPQTKTGDFSCTACHTLQK
jgi:hypothetical protein